MPDYRDYAPWLEARYGQRVYKVPLNIPGGTCPNRDGTVGKGGCIFCESSGSGFQCLPDTMTIREQWSENKAFYERRFRAHKFISYLQTYTNTYMSLERFKEVVLAAAEDEDLVGIAISTRPDCVSDEYLEFLAELKESRNLDIDIELGLQTVNYHNLVEINRGHTLAEYIDAVLRIKRYGLSTTAHVILNLPGDTMLDVIETAKIVSTLGVDFVKLHSLYVAGGTELARRYEAGEFTMITLSEYVERVVTFLEYLDPEIVIQRLVGKGPQDNLLFCNWDTSWWKIKDAIDAEFIARNSKQGSKFDYLNGKAIRLKQARSGVENR